MEATITALSAVIVGGALRCHKKPTLRKTMSVATKTRTHFALRIPRFEL